MTTSTRSASVAERYELLRRIGETRSSEVWEAYDERLDRTVELRLALREDASARQQLRTMLRETRIGDQPDAPRILDGGEDPEYGTFLVAELTDRNAATRPLQPVVERPTYVARSRGDPQVGALVLVPVAVGILLLIIFIARAALAPVQVPTVVPTAEPPSRPLSGAQRDQPTAQPTPVPTLVAPGRAALAQPQAPAQAATAPTPPSAGSPVDTIRQHYALINAKNYAAGYQLMDGHLQNLNSPSDYAGWFANKVSIQPESIDLVSQTDGEAVVRSVVSSTDRVNGQDVTSQVSEQFVLHNENGGWRIDQVTRLS